MGNASRVEPRKCQDLSPRTVSLVSMEALKHPLLVGELWNVISLSWPLGTRVGVVSGEV
jgi:hypothetical protein